MLREGFGTEHADQLQGGGGPRHGDRRGGGAGDKGGAVGNLPSYGMLAEEGGELAGEVDARWIVDPLDGTINYAHGLPIFCVSIALERAGEMVLGVVHDPISEETYVAERGRGATLNGEPINVSNTDELIRALIATGFPLDRAEMPEALDLFGRFAATTQGMRRLGFCGA